VAQNQLALTTLKILNFKSQILNSGSLQLRDDGSVHAVLGKDFALKFDKKNGALSSYVWRGKEQIFAPMLPHFSRPNTDNDRRGWKPARKFKAWYEPNLQLQKMSVSQHNGTASISSEYSLIGDSARLAVSYIVDADGTVKVDFALHVLADSLPNIPRIGLQCGVERSYDSIVWYGRGPHENYVDRRFGAHAAIYALPLNKFTEQYVYPQECGNRTDVRWLALHGNKGEGLLVEADSLLSVSVWPWTEAEINRARHTNELHEAGYLILNLDLQQMGVGGNDTWSEVSAPLEEYQILARDYRYGFKLKVVDRKS
jgi:beta-galactosidase